MSTARPPEGSHRTWRALVTTLLVLFALVLFALVLWVSPGSAVVADAGTAAATPGVAHRAVASSASHSHTRRGKHPPKEGTVAVVVSVVGIIVVIAFVVALGSISARRRTRDGPPAWMRSLQGPHERERGPFR